VPWSKKYFCAPINKTANIEMKNSCKSRSAVVALVLFDINKTRLVLETDKVLQQQAVVATRRSGGRAEVNGGSGTDPPTLRRFYNFFPKNTHF